MDGSLKKDTIDILAMSPEELQAWASEEPQPIPFKTFPLCTDEGRKAFLEEYVFWGNDRIFEAVSHIWDSLVEPKTLRCIGIGLVAGTGGTGKAALAKFLKKALRAALANPEPMPWGPDYPSLDEYHEAAMRYFASDRDYYERAIQHYADLLVAKAGQPKLPPPRLGKVLVGPWLPTAVVNFAIRDEHI
jgi:hypothetical protein